MSNRRTDANGQPLSTIAAIREELKTATPESIRCVIASHSDDPRGTVQSLLASARRRIYRQECERERVLAMYDEMQALGGEGVIIGVDEVGRGPLAGPLTVGAVALRPDSVIWGLNDSKQLTPEQRERIALDIEQQALGIGLAHIEPADIDALGMGVCLRTAMIRAIADTGLRADAVLIDGVPMHVHPLEQSVVQGDARVACIAAASIIAKVTRDAIMVDYDQVYPAYGFAKNKGYGSAEHIEAIRLHGLCGIHRVSFCKNFI